MLIILILFIFAFLNYCGLPVAKREKKPVIWVFVRHSSQPFVSFVSCIAHAICNLIHISLSPMSSSVVILWSGYKINLYFKFWRFPPSPVLQNYNLSLIFRRANYTAYLGRVG